MPRTALLTSLLGVFVVAGGLLRADPAAPYGHDCLKSIEQWTVVSGEWTLQKGVLRADPKKEPGQIFFHEEGFVMPQWYSLRFGVTGLSIGQHELGILLGYADAKNYYLCSIRQTDEQKGRMTLSRVSDGKVTQKFSSAFDHMKSDSLVMTIEVYAQHKFRLRVNVDKVEGLTFESADAAPSWFGFAPSSAEIAITSCELSGIAKK